MKIQYLSDMHLELSNNSRYFKDNYPEVTGDILVIAGDTMYINQLVLNKFWEHCHINYKYTILVPGNHEYYNYTDVSEYRSFKKNILGYDNVFYVNNQIVDIGEDIILICSTLWSEIPYQYYMETGWGLTDFKRIKYNNHIYNQDNYNDEHKYCLKFIKQCIDNIYDKKIVIVTHHMPSYTLGNPIYKGDALNCCFATELYDYIERSPNINAWIYGHSHYNHEDIMIGDTLVTCNQFGYYGENNKSYNPIKFIEV